MHIFLFFCKVAKSFPWLLLLCLCIIKILCLNSGFPKEISFRWYISINQNKYTLNI